MIVDNMFAYGPDGKVFFAALNFPGSWVDGALMAHFLHSFKSKIGELKVSISIDQGFPQSGNVYGTLAVPITKKGSKMSTSQCLQLSAAD